MLDDNYNEDDASRGVESLGINASCEPSESGQLTLSKASVLRLNLSLHDRGTTSYLDHHNWLATWLFGTVSEARN